MNKIIVAALILGLAGCALQQKREFSEKQRQSFLEPICNTPDQCTLMWQKAQLWVIKNSSWKIQVANDVVISTYGPGDSVNLAFTITKEPRGSGKYAIHMRAGCGNMFGCYMDPYDAIMDFNDTVRSE